MTVAFVVGAALRVSVMTGLALLALTFLRQRSAAIRHWLLAITAVCALALPVLQSFIPAWPVPIVLPRQPFAAGEISVLPVAIGGAQTPSLSPGDVATPWNPAAVIGSTWLIGTVLFLTVFAIGLGRLRWLASHAAVMQSAVWKTELFALSRHYQLMRPVRLLQGTHPALLVTWGARTPTILLPTDAHTWHRDRVRVVLAHELAHIARHDWLSQCVGDVLRAAYWFNPLIWLFARRLREESERASDDDVLGTGVDAAAYASHLLELARQFSLHHRPWSPAPAIVSPSQLERRVRAMLNTRLNRTPPTRTIRAILAAAVVALALPVAGLAQASFSTFSGSVVDPMNGLLPRARLVLTNTRSEAKYEVRSDQSGRFEFVGLPPGDYTLETQLPGFATLRGNLTVSGGDITQEIALNVGQLEETITVTDGPARAAGSDRTARKRPTEPCTNTLTSGIGGRIRPPQKIRDVRPVYPSNAADAKPEEAVLLNAVINTDGSVKDVQVVSPAHPAFAAAAVEGVRQWEFDETLLNCVPVEVSMRVNVTFRQE
jgi:TonB family protein